MIFPSYEGDVMPGRPITVQQAEVYMAHREGLGQAGAAAKAGISARIMVS
jgi:hypothetical protein